MGGPFLHSGLARAMARARRCFVYVLGSALMAALQGAAAADLQSAGLLDLSLEQLGEVIVTSVSRRAERLAEAPASVYVISAEDIRRSGARTLPEALRLAPNLQVARADANQYAVSARGFNNVLANKLLVMIDGRTVYSPLFSGVFWESQPVMLEDVERIEVVDGPGGTLWGTNAVNGVINVITRAAGQTQGVLATAGAGNQNVLAGARYGAPAGSGHMRVYGRYLQQDETQRANGSGVVDASDIGLGGFRGDWSDERRTVTVQGEAYGSEIDQVPDGRRVSGTHLLARWTQQIAADNVVRVQAYYDRTERHHRLQFRETLDLFDLDVQQGFRLTGSQRITWGGGYRYGRDNVDNLSSANAFFPEDRSLNWANVYAQDEIALHRDVTLTVGARLERNSYTGSEFLPSVLLGWRIDAERFAWANAARAVRAPSRVDREFYVPRSPPFAIAGGPNFQSEVSNIYQLGYRAQPLAALSYSVTAFYNDQQDLRSLEPRPGGAQFENRISGSTRGITAWGSWRVTPGWLLSLGGTRLWQRLALEPDSRDPNGVAQQGNDPRYWWVLRSGWDLTPRHTLDVFVRRVGDLPRPAVPAYTAVDARLGWRATRAVELSVTLQNLFDPGHSEWGVSANRVEHGRVVFFQVMWQP